MRRCEWTNGGADTDEVHNDGDASVGAPSVNWNIGPDRTVGTVMGNCRRVDAERPGRTKE